MGKQGKSHAHFTSGVIWHFWTWTCTTFNNISIILNLLTKLWTKTKGLCTVRELPTKTTALLFSPFMFGGFPNKSPLITMNSTITCTPINHPSAPNVGNLYNLRVGTFGLADHENYKRFSEFLVDNQSGKTNPIRLIMSSTSLTHEALS